MENEKYYYKETEQDLFHENTLIYNRLYRTIKIFWYIFATSVLVNILNSIYSNNDIILIILFFLSISGFLTRLRIAITFFEYLKNNKEFEITLLISILSYIPIIGELFFLKYDPTYLHISNKKKTTRVKTSYDLQIEHKTEKNLLKFLLSGLIGFSETNIIFKIIFFSYFIIFWYNSSSRYGDIRHDHAVLFTIFVPYAFFSFYRYRNNKLMLKWATIIFNIFAVSIIMLFTEGNFSKLSYFTPLALMMLLLVSWIFYFYRCDFIFNNETNQ